MSQLRSRASDSISPILIVLGSLAILAHFGAVTIRALAAPSGPWVGPEGPSMSPPPSFAQSLDEQVAQGYLKLVRLTHNYHFSGNRPAPGVYVEIRLKDKQKQPLMTLRFPDPDANPWIRHQQELFALGLVPDQPIPAPEGEAIPAPHQDVPQVPIWDITGPQSLRLRRELEHLIPRNRPVMRPTEWSLVLVRSYARYLCRTHGAASAEVVRHSRDVIPPTDFLMREPPAGRFTDLLANYGELSGE